MVDTRLRFSAFHRDRATAQGSIPYHGHVTNAVQTVVLRKESRLQE